MEFAKPFIKWFIIWIIIPGFLFWLYPQFKLYVGVWIFIVIVMAIYDFFDWYLDVVVLTSDNLVHYEWNWFFHNLSTRMAYQSIQSVGYVSTWLWSSIFNYWDLIISRDAWDIIFENAKNPKMAELEILSAQNMVLNPAQQVDPNNLKNLLAELVADNLAKMENRKWFW